jgi:phytoene dehydrogenase-like protein
MKSDVIVIGAGLAGLAAARSLARAGKSVLVLEKAGEVGGRVRSEQLEGCCLDYGYQVLLPAYPSFKALQLKLPIGRYARGAMIVKDSGERTWVLSPLHHPWLFRQHAQASSATLLDFLRLGAQLLDPRRGTTGEMIARRLYSPEFQQHFLEPFLRGVLLDPTLSTPAALSAFFLKMFFYGGAALPARGIYQFPEHLAQDLTVYFHQEVSQICPEGETHVVVRTAQGAEYQSQLVINTAPELQRATPQWLGTSCHYFLYSKPLELQRLVVLLPDAQPGEISHLSNLSEISPGYSPAGTALLSASTVGVRAPSAEAIHAMLCARLGLQPASLLHLRSYQIEKALPVPRIQQATPRPEVAAALIGQRILEAGDGALYGSQHAALFSGQQAATRAIQLLA